ncbi:HEAT repeat domain-containing protein [Coprobacter tertius]|uniref:HEAT repeat domain-containing protein n=1 Tax=Coprobacter tertius TaxID=2944915 RepID=A0ABT1MD14_9BACT|nr:HEAT repeat domain-containing protein [Coprobacter tertius]MCP9610527.1 HEAT repeat domain-containing protein [Coprobacter tertius]
MRKVFGRYMALIAFLSMIPAALLAKQHGFAIVIDPKSYAEARTEVDAYAHSIENSGLKTFIVEDKWGVPDSIRACLISMYKQKDYPIEGAVFVGDIPIAMVRDAQHMTSAFKMNQETFDRKLSSVPSDRFYDDFDLQFKYIDRDNDEPLYFYYSLTPESSQHLSPEIYTGRIKPGDSDGTSRYEKLRRYLRKAVAQKVSGNVLDQMMYFSGHGYISESMMARIDEKIAILENFPWLKQQKNGIEYIDHLRDKYVKFRLMNELQRPDLDLAVLHHHGDKDIQYLNNLPLPHGTKEEIESIKIYLRESLRHAKERGKSVDSIQVVLKNRFDVPDSWFSGAFDPKVKRADSLHIDNLDLYLADFKIYNYNPNVRFVIFDACFNGSFHLDNSIANAYIFSDGETVAATANSVNVLQDKWIDRYAGLVGLGMRVGNMVKYNPYLESHLIGDPTFSFTPAVKVFDINDALVNASSSFWEKQLKNSPYPAVRSMAIEKLMQSGKMTSARLLDIFKNSSDDIVRVQCLVSLSEINDDNFIQCLDLAMDDSYEMVQRFAMNFIAKSGDERLIPAIVRTMIRNNTAERIEFSVKQAMALYDKKKLLDEFDRQFAKTTQYSDKDGVRKAIRHSIEVQGGRWAKNAEEIVAKDTKRKTRLQDIRSLRNYTVHYCVPELLAYVQSANDEEIQVNLLEALGWYNYSYQAPEIAKVALSMSKNNSYSEAIRNEALKTYNRLTGH